MSLLHSYSFENEVDARAYLPFAYSKKGGRGTDCALEVIDASLRGKIDLDRVEQAALEEGDTDTAFNLFAYNCEVQKNRRKVSYVEAGRVLHISGIEEDDYIEAYGVPESVVSEYADAGKPDEYEKLLDEEEVQYAMGVIMGMQNVLLIEYRINFWHCMRQALKGVPESIALMRRLAEDAPDIGELIWIILSSGRSVEELCQSATA
ncbi:MAG: hypothetical protein NC548_25160 [Lachnospiraceae bacterium]|nr:hypothetical protein [Lachnospiraceae bacterium]